MTQIRITNDSVGTKLLLINRLYQAILSFVITKKNYWVLKVFIFRSQWLPSQFLGLNDFKISASQLVGHNTKLVSWSRDCLDLFQDVPFLQLQM